jgi:hypothetical protein
MCVPESVKETSQSHVYAVICVGFGIFKVNDCWARR